MTSTTITGDGPTAQTLAHRLRTDGETVSRVVDRPPTRTYDYDEDTGERRNPESTATLWSTTIDTESTLIVASERDSLTLLVSQLLRTAVGVTDVVVLVEDPRNHALFAETGVEPIVVADVLADELIDRLRSRQSIDEGGIAEPDRIRHGVAQ